MSDKIFVDTNILVYVHDLTVRIRHNQYVGMWACP
jgi:predicted nucleic acid-binding protein